MCQRCENYWPRRVGIRGLQEAVAVTVDAMHAYFLPVRFYSRYYPYMGFRGAMVHIALERTRQVYFIREHGHTWS
jgi:hypothetical protein